MHVSKTVPDLSTQEIYLQSTFSVAVGCFPAEGSKKSCEWHLAAMNISKKPKKNKMPCKKLVSMSKYEGNKNVT